MIPFFICNVKKGVLLAFHKKFKVRVEGEFEIHITTCNPSSFVFGVKTVLAK